MKSVNLVWLKRDLRTQDHEPLFLAEQSRLPYFIIFCFEPTIVKHDDTSLRHLQFQYVSLLRMNEKLNVAGRCVNVFYGEMVDIMNWISRYFQLHEVFSYRESGVRITWQRDIVIAKWCNERAVRWTECQRDGIQRGISHREGWDQQWFHYTNTLAIENVYSYQDFDLPESTFQIPDTLVSEWSKYPLQYQPPGEDYAFRYMHTFVNARGINYNRHISKPTESRLSCGRLSPYLAWGNISVRQVVQYISSHPNSRGGKRWVNGFLTRLKWRDHFIQKFEVECSYETKCVNGGFESLPRSYNPQYIHAWECGCTGFPLVDAAMRCLRETGWINFRMRAMLVSFFCHHLAQDWRWGIYHMARLFLDYEPGIHYPQFQMQAGTTGVNTVRIYNPIKQSKDHDPDGVFIKLWVPELRVVPKEFIHEPYAMSAELKKEIKFQLGVTYPTPIVDWVTAARQAREAIWGHRKSEEVHSENKRILATHVRKISSIRKEESDDQLSFFE